MGENEQKWLKNICVVLLGSLVSPGWLSMRTERLFSTIWYLGQVPMLWADLLLDNLLEYLVDHQNM